MENNVGQAKKEQSPIDSALGQLDNNIGILNDNLGKLSGMIQPILREPDPREGAEAECGGASQLGQRIHKAAMAVSGMTDFVQDLQSRIQI